MRFILFLIVVFGLSSCQFYHNTTARYNAYFLAKEKMLEVEQALFGNPQDDYTSIPMLMSSIDTNTAQSQKEALNYIIEKASQPIQAHKTSKWVDDCYLLIGKARLYAGDFSNAALTFKYINTNSPDKNTRQAALIALMRTFIENKDFKGVETVAKFFSNEQASISPENSRDFYLTLAYYYQVRKALKNTAFYLEKAIPNISKKDQKNRAMYIAAQILRQQKQDEKAYNYYSQILRNNPTYDIAFYAQLNASKTVQINPKNQDEIKKNRRYLRKLLEDENNAAFRDKIFYDLAAFEYKQGNTDIALENLEESLFANQGNMAQLAYTYELLGDIAAQKQQDYQKASLFYDSAALVIPKNIFEATAITEKAQFYRDFAFHDQQIQEADKMLMLAQMKPENAQAFLEREIQIEKQNIDKNTQKYQQRLANRPIAKKEGLMDNKAEKSKWYFYNAEAVSFGKSYFFREWKNRPLEDHWRRSNRNKELGNATTTDLEKPIEKPKPKKDSVDIYASVLGLEERLKKIPKNDTEKQTWEQKLENSLLAMGKLYYEKTKKMDKAAQNLERILTEFPKSSQTPEVLFLMSKICPQIQKCDSALYLKRLQEEFPSSLFAKLVGSKNFVEDSNVLVAEVDDLYKQAYQSYQTNDFANAQKIIDNILSKYPQNQHLDKIQILKIMIIGKTQSPENYEVALQTFMKDFEKSNLIPFAKILWETYQKTKNP